jgi:hypothetical protein
MDSIEIIKECEMPYYSLVKYLQMKYGAVKYDYFTDDIKYLRDRRITRTMEGLYCHHIDEDKGDLLSEPTFAKRAPFEWQKKERLIYCNLIEHLILHLKIIVLRQHGKLDSSLAVNKEFGYLTNGVKFICRNIQNLYLRKEKIKWKRYSLGPIIDNYEDYIFLIAAFIAYVERQIFSDENRASIKDKFDSIIKKVILNSDDSAEDAIYNDIKKVDCNCNNIQNMVNGFEKDFIGYGFPYFAELKLNEKEYGAKSIDEYVSYAFPSYCLGIVDLSNTTPHMWKGEIPSEVSENEELFFVTRIEVCFKLKQGEEAFVRSHKHMTRDDNRLIYDDDNNNMRHLPKIVESSAFLSKKDNKYYMQYKDKNGETKPFTMELTLTYDDLVLFDERYETFYLKYLDGCYFIPE